MDSYTQLLISQLTSSFSIDLLKSIITSEYSTSFLTLLNLINTTYIDLNNLKSIVSQISNKLELCNNKIIKYECIYHHISDIISITRYNGINIYTNNSYILGYSDSLFLNSEKFDKFMIHNDDLSILQTARINILESYEPQLIHFRIKKFNIIPKNKMNMRNYIDTLTFDDYSNIDYNWVWLETSFNLVKHRNVVVLVSRIIPVDTFMGKLRTSEDRLRMTEHVLRQVRHFLDNKLTSSDKRNYSLPSPRTSDEWSQWLYKFRNSNRLISLLEKENSDVIQVTDSSGKYVYVSPTCEKLYGYVPEELIGKNNIETVHPDDMKLTELEAENQSNEISTRVIRRISKDGTFKWVEQTGFIYKENEEANGKLKVGIHIPTLPLTTIPESRTTSPSPLARAITNDWTQICIERDVTSSRSSKHANDNKNIETKIEPIVEEKVDHSSFVSISKETGKIVYITPDACKLVNSSAEILIGKSFYDLLPENYHFAFSRVFMLPTDSRCEVHSHVLHSKESLTMQPVLMECYMNETELLIWLHIAGELMQIKTINSSKSVKVS